MTNVRVMIKWLYSNIFYDVEYYSDSQSKWVCSQVFRHNKRSECIKYAEDLSKLSGIDNYKVDPVLLMEINEHLK